MSFPVGGIDPCQDAFTVGVVDRHGVEIVHEAFASTAAGYGAAIGLIAAHGANRVGVEGSAKWGAHAAIALAAAGFDAREVPAPRSAAQRRSRRLDKTGAVDAVASARAVLAEPTLGPVQALEAYDPPRRRDRGRARAPQSPGSSQNADAAQRKHPKTTPQTRRLTKERQTDPGLDGLANNSKIETPTSSAKATMQRPPSLASGGQSNGHTLAMLAAISFER